MVFWFKDPSFPWFFCSAIGQANLAPSSSQDSATVGMDQVRSCGVTGFGESNKKDPTNVINGCLIDKVSNLKKLWVAEISVVHAKLTWNTWCFTVIPL